MALQQCPYELKILLYNISFYLSFLGRIFKNTVINLYNKEYQNDKSKVTKSKEYSCYRSVE